MNTHMEFSPGSKERQYDLQRTEQLVALAKCYRSMALKKVVIDECDDGD